jgi:hypothetical protein
MAKRLTRRPSARASWHISPARFRELEQAVERNTADLALQLRRIAQMQAELDTVKKAWTAVKLPRQ